MASQSTSKNHYSFPICRHDIFYDLILKLKDQCDKVNTLIFNFPKKKKEQSRSLFVNKSGLVYVFLYLSGIHD